MTFFAAAIQGMDSQHEAAFLEKLSQAKREIQVDMALETIVDHLDPDAVALLHRLPVYQTAVAPGRDHQGGIGDVTQSVLHVD